MVLARMTRRLVFAGVLAQATLACGNDDPKADAKDYSMVKLSINEMQASNQTTVMDDYNEPDDWIELYNAGDEDLDLTGFYISDDRAAPTKHQLPPGVVVDAGGFVIIWADGTATQGPNHLPFKLSAAGESVVISDPNVGELDAMDFVLGALQSSFARHPDGIGEFDWCAAPTPGVTNGEVCTPPATL